jgi:hypothetical protein
VSRRDPFGLLVLIVVVVLGGYLFATWWLSSAIRSSIDATGAAMMASDFACPDGTFEKVSRWSKAGWARYCEADGRKEGPWQAWEEQKLVVQGSYSRGKEQGTFTWFHSDGKTYRQKIYRHGEEIADKIFDAQAAPK